MAPQTQSQRLPPPSQPSGKGEVGELKMQLRQLAGSRAPGVEDLKRELYKKVISYMTVGIDVSSLFSEMVMCSATSDIVLKKMCYLYVGNYARVHPDLALLTINFLQKDCQDDDPMIRGLALRSLCSLSVKNLVEYLVGPLRAGLQDSNSYVRTVAAIGVLKLYHISPTTCTESDFPVALKALLLHDPDAQVNSLMFVDSLVIDLFFSSLGVMCLKCTLNCKLLQMLRETCLEGLHLVEWISYPGLISGFINFKHIPPGWGDHNKNGILVDSLTLVNIINFISESSSPKSNCTMFLKI